LVALVVSVLTFLWTAVPAIYDYATEPSAQLDIRPAAAVSGPHLFQVEGQSDNIDAAHGDLWLVLRAESNQSYYPVDRISPDPDGHWSINPNDVVLSTPGLYTLYLYLVDSSASAILRATADKDTHAVADQAEGLPAIPSGAQYMDAKTITRTQ
jgi:hypothetical protein